VTFRNRRNKAALEGRCQITEKLAQLNVKKLVCLHGILKHIIFNRDQRFQARFWHALQKAFGTKLNFSSSYHRETDGKTKWVNKILEDMLEHVYFISNKNGNNSYPWWNLSTIIFTNPPSKWPLLKHSMEESVRHPYTGVN